MVQVDVITSFLLMIMFLGIGITEMAYLIQHALISHGMAADDVKH